MSWLLRALVGRVVLVQADGLKTCGRLLAFSDSERSTHKPESLVLETDSGFCIVRGWTVIAFGGRL